MKKTVREIEDQISNLKHDVYSVREVQMILEEIKNVAEEEPDEIIPQDEYEGIRDACLDTIKGYLSNNIDGQDYIDLSLDDREIKVDFNDRDLVDDIMDSVRDAFPDKIDMFLKM